MKTESSETQGVPPNSLTDFKSKIWDKMSIKIIFLKRVIFF